jgi:LacI family transcriptional regulator
VSGPADLPRTRERVGGFMRAMDEAGLVAPPERLLHEAFTSAGGHAAFTHLLAQAHPPTAVFVTSDLMALGGLCAASCAGVRVPGQLSVVGYDDIDGAVYASPPLTTVAPPKREMACLAIARLIKRIKGGAQLPGGMALDSRLVVRASAAPLH